MGRLVISTMLEVKITGTAREHRSDDFLKCYPWNGEAEAEEVRGVKALKKARMMQMKDESGNAGSLEYNKSQSACTKPSTRGESERREEQEEVKMEGEGQNKS